MRARSELAALCALALALAPDQASAQPAPVTDPAATATARRLYEEGIKHYNVAEYDEAIAAFREAYWLTSAPELLYDIAQSYRLRGPGSCGSALKFYKSFLRLEPRTPRRASVEAAIADMERCARTEQPARGTDDDPHAAASAHPPAEEPARPPPTVPASRPLASRPTVTAPLVVGGAGLGLSLAGAGLLLWSRLRYDAISDDGCAPSCDPSRVDGPRVAQPIGGVLLGVGAALVVAGVVLWLVRPRPDREARAL